jgi:hypothetical protein
MKMVTRLITKEKRRLKKSNHKVFVAKDAEFSKTKVKNIKNIASKM